MVYVDNMFETKLGRVGRMRMSHMIADSSEELFDMATRIGLDHKWVQFPGSYKEHFDICLTKRKRAVELGAKEITWKELGQMTINKK